MKKIFLAGLILIAVVVVAFSVRLIWGSPVKTESLMATSYFYRDLIRIDSPAQNPKTGISSPIKVSGVARGNWYFEASFPVQVLDEDGTILGSGIAQAREDWMTTDFVSFSGEINFNKPKGRTGTVVFKKDNPSGLPENEDSVSIPINFR